MTKNRLKFSYWKLFIQLLIGLFLGAMVITFYISSDGRFQDKIVAYLKKDFRDRYNCNFNCSIDKIDPILLKIHFSSIEISPIFEGEIPLDKDSWQIYSEKFTLSCSWISFFTKFCFDISGTFDGLLMYERYKNDRSGMMNFLRESFSQKMNKYIVYDYLGAKNSLFLSEQIGGKLINLPFDCNTSYSLTNSRVQVNGKKGSLFFKDRLLIDSFSGSLFVDLPVENVAKELYLQTNFEMNIIPLSDQGHAVFSGSMKKGVGDFNFKNDDLSVFIDSIQIRADSKKSLFDFSAIVDSKICKQFNIDEICKNIDGKVHFDLSGDFYDFYETLNIDLSIDDIGYKSKKILSGGKLIFKYKNPGAMIGQFLVRDECCAEIVATISNGRFNSSIKNIRDIPIFFEKYWIIPSGGTSIDIDAIALNLISMNYKIGLHSEKLNEDKLIEGRSSISGAISKIEGRLDQFVYEVLINLNSDLILEKAVLSRDDIPIIDFHSDENDHSKLTGRVDYSFLREVVSEKFKASFAQDRFIEFEGNVKNGIYYSKLQTKNGNIRIPNIYNVIQNITASCMIDLYNRSLVFENIKIDLYEGKAECSRANILLDSSGKFSFIHLPLILDNVMLSWDRGIFLLLSGALLLHKSENGKANLSGQLIVDKSHLKENIFSSELQERLFGSSVNYKDGEMKWFNCSLNIDLFTKDLLQIQTSFLSSKARLDLALRGDLKKPEISGIIQLTSGSFYFPYRSLDISEGKIFFMPDQPFDPLIEVLAKGKLKRFGVAMRVTGSVFDPNVQFDSIPYLTEEQIVSLLLLGIEENSLSAMVPVLLTQRLKDLVFGPALSTIKLKSRYDKLMESLSSFRFLPKFTDQSGRGGMRGVFEIDASDHLHAKIDTDFIHLEDTRFDVDFDIADDLTFRVQKDGPSTYGGEIEFRWKFR